MPLKTGNWTLTPKIVCAVLAGVGPTPLSLLPPVFHVCLPSCWPPLKAGDPFPGSPKQSEGIILCFSNLCSVGKDHRRQVKQLWLYRSWGPARDRYCWAHGVVLVREVEELGIRGMSPFIYLGKHLLPCSLVQPVRWFYQAPYEGVTEFSELD